MHNLDNSVSVIEISASHVLNSEPSLSSPSLSAEDFFLIILVVTLGQPEVAISPDSLHIETLTCVVQYSVGTVSSVKYSVITQFHSGSCSHKPSTGRSPELEHTAASTIPDGCS